MKLICTQENLIKGLNIVSHIAGKNVSLPILNNILFKAGNSVISLISTNLDIGIKTLIRGKVDTPGELTVPARLITDYVSLLELGNVELEKRGNDLIVKTSKQETIIKGREADEYPILPEVDDIEGFSLAAKEFKEALSQVVFSASYDDIRPELSGILLVVNDDKLLMVATDSYRLAQKVVELDKGKISKIRKIVPLRVLQEILRILPEENKEIKIAFSDNQVVFRFNETVIVSRLIEGNYPDYEEIIPKECKSRVIINKNELTKAVKTASLFSKTGINDILLEFNIKEKDIKISAANVQLGENKASLPVEITGENNSVVFNYKYLLDGLQNMPGKKVVFELNSSDAPVLLKPENDKSYLYLIMPIRR